MIDHLEIFTQSVAEFCAFKIDSQGERSNKRAGLEVDLEFTKLSIRVFKMTTFNFNVHSYYDMVHR